MGWGWRKREKNVILARGAKLLEDLIECCDGKSNPIKFFSVDEIRKATDDFSKSNRISKVLSGFSGYTRWTIWYSGKNKNHCKILVRHKEIYVDEDICRDIAVSSMVSGHKNFLKLVGCCLEFESPVMVYGVVKKHYNLDISVQTWKRRMKIAEDIATALAYLHTAFPRPFVYRCMSPDNIFVDEDGDAKLTDFSCCVSIPEGETFVQVERIVGAYKYLNDKYKMYGVVSEETDVFAIGILMIWFLMGEKKFRNYHGYWKGEAYGEGEDDDDDDSATMWNSANPICFNLFKFVEKRRMEEIADPEMAEKMVGDISEQDLCQMKAFLMLSLRCVGHKAEIPTMVEVAKELKKLQTSLITDDSSSPSGETQFNSPQAVPSTVLLTNQTTNTKPLLTCIAMR